MPVDHHTPCARPGACLRDAGEGRNGDAEAWSEAVDSLLAATKLYGFT